MEVFISSKQEEFREKRKRLEKIVNFMPYLSCHLLEKRGADADDTRTRSVKAVKECDFYIGVFGREYSLITHEECKTTLDNNIVLNANDEEIDPHVHDFIKNELEHRISYYKFSSCKQLEEQIRKDLEAQMIQILRIGLEEIAKTKEEVKNKEQEFKDSIYLSSSPSDKNTVLSLIEMAKSDFHNENYLDALINTSTYIELLLRRNLTESRHKDYSKAPFHLLLRESLEQNLLSTNMLTKLKVFWNIRNKALLMKAYLINVNKKNLLKFSSNASNVSSNRQSNASSIVFITAKEWHIASLHDTILIIVIQRDDMTALMTQLG